MPSWLPTAGGAPHPGFSLILVIWKWDRHQRSSDRDANHGMQTMGCKPWDANHGMQKTLKDVISLAAERDLRGGRARDGDGRLEQMD